ncbi:PhnD/SsuA/transferrin family substrate-binding protein [Pseudaquabacterium rugosum]|uniref:PhnD/SsuA/transferrin family substrate-binding protein n=1 Tax=Pseudaquabacterium rugosum TaxID=2984194 RepID=A0ABU9B7G9_9BURK
MSDRLMSPVVPMAPSSPASPAQPAPSTPPATGALQVQTGHEDGPGGARLCLRLHGEIDVHATPVLAGLQGCTPPGGRLTLDFSGVSRCNSMGLAQLLRLLEHWRTAGLQPEVQGLNRTLAMLFKMTGLMRYFGGSTAPPADAPRLTAPAAVRPPTLALKPAALRLDFHVSQQNSQQLIGWYYLNTLLQRALGRAIALTVDDLDAPGARPSGAPPVLAFARPFDACALMDAHGYLPVARPAGNSDEVSDEVSLIVRQDEPRTALADFAGARTITAHTRSFVQVLGRFFCDESGLDSASLQMAEAGSEIGALKALLAGQADLLLMSRRGHARLSALARAGVRVLDQSETGVASHLLLLRPDCAALAAPLRAALTGLSGHDKGRQALQDLGLSAWDVPADEEIAMLRRLYQRYAG